MEKLSLQMKSFGKQIISCGYKTAKSTQSPRAKSTQSPRDAPHPIPEGMEGQPCPISGLFADEAQRVSRKSQTAEALAALQADPDIAEENKALAAQGARQPGPGSLMTTFRPMDPRDSVTFLALSVVNKKHIATEETRNLVRSVGGLPTLRRFTKLFYERCFVDPHLDKFIANHHEPHGERFATWIAEKLGDGTPWTEERRTRPVRKMVLEGNFGPEVVQVAFDRSSAHYAAWHSPKRESNKWGEHFKLDDARVWMRLHFWAARETGMFEHKAFMDYYVRFIAHFVSIYSSKSPTFARDSARWSADPARVQAYLDAGNRMTDVMGKSLEESLKALPAGERKYTGSGGPNAAWPYENSP